MMLLWDHEVNRFNYLVTELNDLRLGFEMEAQFLAEVRQIDIIAIRVGLAFLSCQPCPDSLDTSLT